MRGGPTGRCFNSVDFWQHLDTFPNRFADRAHAEPESLREQKTIAVVGNGLTAAPIVEELLDRLPPKSQILVISNTGMLYTRGEGYFETRVYGSPDHWNTLSLEHRRDFLARNNRAVFSLQAQEKIKASRVLVEPRAGEADMEHLDTTIAGNVKIPLVYDHHGGGELIADYLVDGRNLNRASFIGLFEESVQAELASLADKLQPPREGRRDDIERRRANGLSQAVEADLSLRDFAPDLHLPMLADLNWGPGLANLYCLGLLSDRILSRYVELPNQ